MSNALYNNDTYSVIATAQCFNTESGEGYVEGYAIVNNQTGVVEATSRVYPEAQWRADQFKNMIIELAKEPDLVEALDDAPDVLIN